MSEVRLNSSGSSAHSGVIRFDGEVFEMFGFATDGSRRIHIATIQQLELSFKSGMLATPTISMSGRNGGMSGIIQAIKPDEAEAVDLTALVAEVNEAAARYPNGENQ
ncbi:MAG TPA: hypothetical protein P5138_04415 [Solirubrobacterales bacterium]|nr:hypothetical protein [Solirubrobacterales bacterium]